MPQKIAVIRQQQWFYAAWFVTQRIPFEYDGEYFIVDSMETMKQALRDLMEAQDKLKVKED